MSDWGFVVTALALTWATLAGFALYTELGVRGARAAAAAAPREADS
jgi:hypothetical protein